MGRPSVLTDPMRTEIGRRLAAGESLRAVSKSTGVAYTTLRRNFSDQVPQIREVAVSLAYAENKLAHLPVSAQRAARTLADQLREVQDGYAAVAVRSTKTAEKIANIAGRIADEIPEGLNAPEAMASVLVVGELHKAVNLALTPATNLVAVNKGKDQDQAKSLEDLLEEANQKERLA